MSANAPPRIFFVAGESSGDIHGANLINAMRQRDPAIQCEGLGGTNMAAAGMTLHYDLAGDAIMGFVEVVKSLAHIRRLYNQAVARLQEWQPHCLVLIDYPGFNVRLAREAHRLGIPIVYYISPQVWAWKKGRIKVLAQICQKMLVVFPFEKSLYDDAGLDCAYVGHPLIDHIQAFEPKGIYPKDGIVGLLPGSREQEIRRILPVMIETAAALKQDHPDMRFVAPCVDRKRADQIAAMAQNFPVETPVNKTYEVLSAARFALVASGTATVEATLFGTPFIILYKVNPLTYAIAQRLVDIDHIGMVNILAGSRVVPEFVQSEAASPNVIPIARDLIADTPCRQAMLDNLARVRRLLGGPGASQRAAEQILEVAGSTIDD